MIEEEPLKEIPIIPSEMINHQEGPNHVEASPCRPLNLPEDLITDDKDEEILELED